jgi:hypothetical protein
MLSEKGIPFDTTYEILNPATEVSKKFEFKNSTGSEWEADTKWIYKSEDGITLEVCNDPHLVKERAAAYLAAKLRN